MVLGERPTILYFGNGFWSYVGRLLLAYLGMYAMILALFIPLVMFVVPMMPGTDTLFHGRGIPNAAQIMKLALPVLGLFIVSAILPMWWLLRHIPYFTARAVEDWNLKWAAASLLMRGHVAGCWVGTMLAVLPIMIPQVFLTIAMQGIWMQLPWPIVVIFSVLTQILTFATIVISSSVGALFYNTLVKREPIALPQTW